MKLDKDTPNRIYYIIEETTAYLISIIISGAYLATITGELGFSDSLTAILSSAVTLGCCFQLFAVIFFRSGKAKRKVTFFYTLNELLFVFLYLIPLLDISSSLKSVLFALSLLSGHFIMNIVFSPKTTLFMAFIPDKKRGVFTSIKEACSLVTGIIFQLIMGHSVDYFRTQGDIRSAFIFCGATIFVLTILHTLSIILTKEKTPETKTYNSFADGFKVVFYDKTVLKVTFLSVLWALSNSSLNFYGTYLIKELGFNMTFIATMSVFSASARILASFFLGSYADKHSFSKMLKICYFLLLGCFIAMIFTMPETGRICYPIYVILHACALGGINSAETNIIFDLIAPEKRTNALAVKQTVYGLSGFLTTLCMAPLVNHIQASGNKFLHFDIYAQQVLSIFSAIVVIIMLIYLNKVILKKKRAASPISHSN